MPLLLEAFDASAPVEPSGPSPDWLDGHAAGLAEGLALGRADAEAETAHLSRELSRGLQDMAFAYAEAREQVLVSLRPLFGLLMDRLLPATAAASLGPRVAELLLDAARADSMAPLVVEVHPDRLPAVQACLPPSWPATLRPDLSLGLEGARITTPARESDLDLDACLATLRAALSAFLDSTEGLIRHG